MKAKKRRRRWQERASGECIERDSGRGFPPAGRFSTSQFGVPSPWGWSRAMGGMLSD